MSLPRNGRFQGFALEDELLQRKAEPWCGLAVIDLRHGDIIEWVRLGGDFTEMFDVGLIPATRAAAVIGPESSDMQDHITREVFAEFPD